jgi:hypothetical protein
MRRPALDAVWVGVRVVWTGGPTAAPITPTSSPHPQPNPRKRVQRTLPELALAAPGGVVVADIGAPGPGGVAIADMILLTRWYPADPIIALGIAVLIAQGAWRILRETVDILMEATPKGLNMAQFVRDVVRVRGVSDARGTTRRLSSSGVHPPHTRVPPAQCCGPLSRGPLQSASRRAGGADRRGDRMSAGPPWRRSAPPAPPTGRVPGARPRRGPDPAACRAAQEEEPDQAVGAQHFQGDGQPLIGLLRLFRLRCRFRQ